MRFNSVAFFIGLYFAGLVYGQIDPPDSQTPASVSDDRIRVVVDVVSVDAIVTNKEGQHVKDLEMSDFEVYQDGELQRISNFSYVNAVPAIRSSEVIGPDRDGDLVDRGAEAYIPGFPVQRKDILRSIALVVDDMGMSFENLVFVREALREFVEEQIHPTDLVAISLTGCRTGALSQFTANKDLLQAAVNRIRWGPVHRARPYDRGSFDRQFSEMKRGETIEERNLAVGTLRSLKYTLDSMEDLPGRKSVILVSEGFRLGYEELEGVGGSTDYMVESLREVMHAAHRSGAVVYAVDPRGGESLGLQPQDDLSGVARLAQEIFEEVERVMEDAPDIATGWRLIDQRTVGNRLRTMSIEDVKKIIDPEAFAKISTTRLNRFYQTQQGLNYLPVATGGLYLKYNNDINANLEHVLNDQEGYYLIGYAPDPESIRSRGTRRFPRIKVKVKRDGLEVRGRATFMGTLDGDDDRPSPTPEERMHEYMTSPFPSGQIKMELTSLFEHDPREGAFVSSWLYVDSKQLAFSTEDDEWRKAEIEVWVAAFGEKPEPQEEKKESFSIRVRGQSYEQVLRDGLVCRVRLPAEKPGPYQLRAVVRDKGSGRIGAANRFLEIPDIRTGRLTLSGIVVRGSNSDATSLANNEMALRRFRRGALLNYALYIYNAQFDTGTLSPQLETQVKLFRNGREIYAGKKEAFDLAGRMKDSVLLGSGFLQLGAEMHTGHYAMQYIVTDNLADDGHGTVSQWIDFEILD